MSELRGDLIRPKNPPESRLRGSLAKPSQVEEPAAIGVGSNITQRDSGIIFILEKINKTKQYPNGLAILRGPDGRTFAKPLDQLNSVLQEENGAWRR